MIDFYNYKEEKYKLITAPAEQLERSKAELHSMLKIFQFNRLGWLRSAAAGISIGLAFSLTVQDISTVIWSKLLLDASLGSLFGMVAYAYLFSVARILCLKKLRKIEVQQANQEQANYLPGEITADQVFKVALGISVTGFIVVIAGVSMILYHETEQAYMITSAGIISECLAALFLSFYSKMISRIMVYRPKTFQFKFE